MILNRENYFSTEAQSLYLGSSSLKAWDIFHDNGCEAKQVAIKKGLWTEKDKLAYLVGSYVHSYNEGAEAMQQFIFDHPEMIARSGKNKGGFKKDFVIADKMINVLKNDPLVQKIREGGKEKIFVGKIGGVDFKIQVDILNLKENYFADLKTTKSLSETYWNNEIRQKETFIDKYDYYLQFAIYAEILRQNFGMIDYLAPYIIAVDKQEEPDHEVIYMGTNFIKEKLEYVKTILPHIMDVRNGTIEPIRCEHCDYCRSTKKCKEPITLKNYKENLYIYD